MRIGLHIRTSKGFMIGLRTAAELGCEAIQVFAQNPNAWRSGPIAADRAAEFRRLSVEYDLKPAVIHTPYLLNLASPNEEIYSKSTAALVDAMHRASVLNADYVVTHIGSHRGMGLEAGIERVCASVAQVLNTSEGESVLLLENSAGAGDSVGSHFEDLRTIMDCLSDYEGKIGICLDSAHLWGAGYDVSGKEAVDAVFSDFDSIVGLKWLKLLHLNDTHVELNCHRDRHANVGTGKIGEEGFAAIINHPALAHLSGIIETPPRPPEAETDVEVLKRLRL